MSALLPQQPHCLWLAAAHFNWLVMMSPFGLNRCSSKSGQVVTVPHLQHCKNYVCWSPGHDCTRYQKCRVIKDISLSWRTDLAKKAQTEVLFQQKRGKRRWGGRSLKPQLWPTLHPVHSQVAGARLCCRCFEILQRESGEKGQWKSSHCRI